MMIRARFTQNSVGLMIFLCASGRDRLVLELQNAGYLVLQLPCIRCISCRGGTLPKGNARKVYLNFRNNLIMMAKNLPAGEAFWKIFLRFNLDAISAVKSLFAGQELISLQWSRLTSLFLLVIFHNTKQQGRKKSIAITWLISKSIVWRHFAEGENDSVKLWKEKIKYKLYHYFCTAITTAWSILTRRYREQDSPTIGLIHLFSRVLSAVFCIVAFLLGGCYGLYTHRYKGKPEVNVPDNTLIHQSISNKFLLKIKIAIFAVLWHLLEQLFVITVNPVSRITQMRK